MSGHKRKSDGIAAGSGVGDETKGKTKHARVGAAEGDESKDSTNKESTTKEAVVPLVTCDDLARDIKDLPDRAVILFTSEKAKYVATPFLFGTNKMLVYGLPLILAKKKEFAHILTDVKSLADNPLHLGQEITLTHSNREAFVLIWLELNEVYFYQPKSISLLTLLHMRKFHSYFATHRCHGCHIDCHIADGLMRQQTPLIEEEKLLLTEFHKQQFDFFTKDPHVRCFGFDRPKLLRASAKLLDIKLDAEFATLELYSRGCFYYTSYLWAKKGNSSLILRRSTRC